MAGGYFRPTIARELGYVQGLGFHPMRVFLHHLVWQADPAGFKQRVGSYLALADKHRIQTIFVLFDACWNSNPKVGPQPAPRPGIHNSGWMQDPGEPASRDSATFMGLRPYVTDMLSSFGHDKRVLFWNLYNEPGNSTKGLASLPLLRNTFAWARAAHPEQPLSAGLWHWTFEALNTFQATHSDIITYHDYDEAPAHQRVIELLATHGRPLCPEYMAPPQLALRQHPAAAEAAPRGRHQLGPRRGQNHHQVRLGYAPGRRQRAHRVVSRNILPRRHALPPRGGGAY